MEFAQARSNKKAHAQETSCYRDINSPIDLLVYKHRMFNSMLVRLFNSQPLCRDVHVHVDYPHNEIPLVFLHKQSIKAIIVSGCLFGHDQGTIKSVVPWIIYGVCNLYILVCVPRDLGICAICRSRCSI